tara:strand:+ start:530 stop:937 length:408 start_codon:yes stop_codon:yes gene_type:complete
MAAPKSIKTDPKTFLEVLNDLSVKSDKSYVWMYQLESALNKKGLFFINDDGSELTDRAVRLYVGKSKKEVALTLAKDTGMDVSEARKQVDAVLLKRLEAVPDIGFKKGEVKGWLDGLTTAAQARNRQGHDTGDTE